MQETSIVQENINHYPTLTIIQQKYTEMPRGQQKIADYVMIGRGAMYDPTLFSTLQDKKADSFEIIFRHLDYLSKYFDGRYAATTVRKFWGYYLKGIRDTHKLKVELMQLEDVEAVKNLLKQFLKDNSQ